MTHPLSGLWLRVFPGRANIFSRRGSTRPPDILTAKPLSVDESGAGTRLNHPLGNTPVTDLTDMATANSARAVILWETLVATVNTQRAYPPVVQKRPQLPFPEDRADPEPTHRVLSLGGGVQSTVLALLSAKTDSVPTVDAAVCSDTGEEHAYTYEHLDWLKTEISEFPIIRVSNNGRRLGDDVLHGVNETGQGEARYGYPYYSIPLFSTGGGLTRGTCTAKYKIRPIERALREQILGIPPGKRAKTKVKPEKPACQQLNGKVI